MKKILSIVLFGLVSSMAYSADKLTLQLQWVTQAQFAGYYDALDKGYYNDENLNVTKAYKIYRNWKGGSGATPLGIYQ